MTKRKSPVLKPQQSDHYVDGLSKRMISFYSTTSMCTLGDTQTKHTRMQSQTEPLSLTLHDVPQKVLWSPTPEALFPPCDEPCSRGRVGMQIDAILSVLEIKGFFLLHTLCLPIASLLIGNMIWRPNLTTTIYSTFSQQHFGSFHWGTGHKRTCLLFNFDNSLRLCWNGNVEV